MTLHQKPEFGARFLFDLLESSDEQAKYALEVSAESAVFRTGVSLAAGATSFEAWTPNDPDEWTLKQARSFATILAKHKKDDPEGPWPKRIHRWRERK